MGFTGEEAAVSPAAAAGDGDPAGPPVAPGPLARTSLLRYSPAFIVLAALIADSNRHTDPDLWGHLRFGQEFIARGHLIRQDPYSYSAPGAPWHDYEWLGEVMMALVYNAAGVVGLKLWKFACTALTIVFIADTEAETGAPPTLQLAVLLVAALGLVLQAQFRPQMFTFMMLAGLLALLARDNYRRDAPLWLAMPMMALWANLHAGFFLGVIALGVYAGVATLSDLAAGDGWRRGVRLGLVTAAATGATLANPLGVTLWQAVAHTLVQPYTRGAISEWQSTASAMVQQWHAAHSSLFFFLPAVLFSAGLAIAFALTARGGDLPLIAIAAMMAVGAWLSARNMALVAVTASGPLARHLALVGERLRRGAAIPARSPVNQWLILALCAFLAVQGGLFSGQLALDRSYPAGALAFMREHHLHGNVLSEWEWGGYLIWHGAPADKVFVDGRSDSVHPIYVIRDFLLFRFGLSGGGRVLDSYPNDFVLISTDDKPARRLMDRRTDWKLVYRDNAALLYARANSPVARISGLPVTGTAQLGGFP
jgi:hypothetical protein